MLIDIRRAEAVNLFNHSSTGTQFGRYLWAVFICVRKQPSYGGFSILMPYPPPEGRSLEFYDTPEGDFSGTVIKITEVVKFESCEVIKLGNRSLFSEEIKVQPSVIEFRVWIDVNASSELTRFGVPEM